MVHHSTLLLLCCSIKLWRTQRGQRFETPRWSLVILFTLPGETPSPFCISSCLILGFSSIGDFLHWRLLRATATVVVFQRLLSQNGIFCTIWRVEKQTGPFGLFKTKFIVYHIFCSSHALTPRVYTHTKMTWKLCQRTFFFFTVLAFIEPKHFFYRLQVETPKSES